MIHGFGPKETGAEQNCLAAILPLILLLLLPLILSLTSDLVNPATLQYPQHRPEKITVSCCHDPDINRDDCLTYVDG